MSSVNNEGRQNNDLLRIKEEMYAKESEGTKKHKAEIKKLNEQHQQQIDKLTNDHSTEIQQLRGYLRNRLNEKEIEHRDQIQGVRDVFEAQVKKRTEESQTLREQQKKAFDARVESLENTFGSKTSRLQDEFNHEMAKRDQAYRSFTDKAKEDNTKSWTTRKEKLNQHNEEKLIEERRNHTNQMVALNRDMNNMRKSKDFEIQQLKLQGESKRKSLENQNMLNQENQRQLSFKAHQDMTRELQSSQKLNNEEFRDELQRRYETVEKMNEDFREKTTNKIDNQVNRLAAAIKGEKDQHVRDVISAQRQAAVEKKHMTAAFEKQLGSERQQKVQLLDNVNTDIRKQVDEAVKSRDNQIRNMSENYLRDRQGKLAIKTTQLNQMKNDMESRIFHAETRSEAEIERANERYRQNNVRMTNFYADNLELLKKEYARELNDSRVRNINERADMENRLTSRMLERERQMAMELESTNNKFTKVIAELKEKSAMDLRHQEAKLREEIDNRERQHKEAMQSTEMKHQNQLRQAMEQNDQEIDRLDKRHQLELNQLAQKLSQRIKKS
ncbi:MAG: hypothetical protein RJB66_1636 [Pseudomonadota bacterium]